MNSSQPTINGPKDRKWRPRLLSFLAIVSLMLSVSALQSCDDDDDYYYSSPITGTWLAVNSPGYDYNEFTFYNDGTGYYGAYDARGNWYTWDITWAINGSRLTVYVSSGQVWRYFWRVKGYYLYLDDGYSEIIYELE